MEKNVFWCKNDKIRGDMMAGFVVSKTTSSARDTAISNMKAITQERAQIVRNYRN